MPTTIPQAFRRAVFGLAALAITTSVWAADLRPQPVGMQTAHYADEARRNWSETGARPLETSIWYPAVAGTQERAWETANFKAGRSAGGAAMSAAPARMPLVILSHGTGAAASAIAWLGETLAANGYIVAAANHHGNTAAEATRPLQGTLVWWDRPRDVSVLIDRLLADPVWGPRIDTSRIGIAGFSIGGYTALASVGARLSRAQWRAFCLDPATEVFCQLPPEVSGRFPAGEDVRLLTQDPRVMAAVAHMEDDYRDPRIRAAFSMAPVVGGAVRRDSLGAVAVPVHILVGADDDQAAPRWNAEPLAKAIPGAELTVFPGVTHYSFLPVCSDKALAEVPQSCMDSTGVDRAALHRQVGAMALEFFGGALRGSR
ncbi:alpha/beta fold hydrolase [Hydrogenophaga sp.]|uniref:alpha/beta hydrolase family protein n=1 Tax=Hydrogenophaga sp. TaxID=1904254 RepID=UPI0027167B84|nr:alpha/beta fold hydrolase [Hydrogenophaga sp.]MDO9437866.1 alpha/beta hydrolase [Hydrogenophaga sp.]